MKSTDLMHITNIVVNNESLQVPQKNPISIFSHNLEMRSFSIDVSLTPWAEYPLTVNLLRTRDVEEVW